MSPARRCAFEVVRRVFEHGAYADRAFNARAGELSPRDRTLAQAISYGTVQRRLTLDHVAQRLVGRSLGRLEPAVRDALRIGLYQLLYTHVAPHAAVDDSVELAKEASPRGSRLVNAVLRRASDEGEALLAGLNDSDPASAALLHSVPPWLAQMWWDELGETQTRELLRRINEPAESALRVNLLVGEPDRVRERLPVAGHPAPGVPEGIVLEQPFDAYGSELWREGAIMPQSRASMLVGHVVAPKPGEQILDLCAAPGAKTTHLAALIQDSGAVVAVERHGGRARALEQTCRRMRVRAAEVVVADATSWRSGKAFDRVLVDPPCSGLGTLQSRPDRRWRASPDSILTAAVQQLAILASAAASTRPGGTVTYSVCTISRQEGEQVVERFLRAHPGFAADDLGARYPAWRHDRQPSSLQLLPHRDHTDGFFIARLRRG